MKVYRIAGKKHASNIYGSGAAMFGGRWNKKGSPVLYTGESKELALLEIIVHTPPAIVPALDILTLEIPDDSIYEIEIKDLPDNWTNYPAPSILAEIAEEWINSNRSIALKVPSSVIHSSRNYILNCRHPEYHRVKVIEQVEFRFDQRLIK
ncbi:RES family NAD+ phosphorylase [Algoriphagus aquimarinus]|uniref:RES domain-containing protein n=1 Tax=Algoriphagus aquimarinus TaxID=237018 RepID=A0A5C7AXR6_9BACT|nr:RES family NAD+ phosphorylase [Algoriphagus aquimarinus]TXE13301.1 RES domain-containing protein [Algoriphagus aquimarinus]